MRKRKNRTPCEKTSKGKKISFSKFRSLVNLIFRLHFLNRRRKTRENRIDFFSFEIIVFTLTIEVNRARFSLDKFNSTNSSWFSPFIRTGTEQIIGWRISSSSSLVSNKPNSPDEHDITQEYVRSFPEPLIRSKRKAQITMFNSFSVEFHRAKTKRNTGLRQFSNSLSFTEKVARLHFQAKNFYGQRMWRFSL